MSHPVSGVKLYAKHPAWTPAGPGAMASPAAGDYQQFNQQSGLREFTIGPFSLIHSWDERSSVGDGTKQMRPNLFDEYEEVDGSFVTLFGTAGSFQLFLETCEADANIVSPLTLKYEYATGEEDEAAFGVGANKNPVNTGKVVLTEFKLIPWGTYTKTRTTPS